MRELKGMKEIEKIGMGKPKIGVGKCGEGGVVIPLSICSNYQSM